MSDKMMVTGYSADNQGFLNNTPQPLDANMPFTGSNDSFGMPVTVKAYFGMLINFYKLLVENPEANRIFQGIYWVEFSKASLFRILSQPGCEYVRFNFAVPEPNEKLSLLAHGLDINRKEIGYDEILRKARENDMVAAPGDPSFEERGNGGGSPKPPTPPIFDALKEGGTPMLPPELADLIEQLNATNP